MSTVVVDASVAIKWLIPQRPEEDDVENALQLFGLIETQELLLVQPPHFIAEVMAVATRLEPAFAERILNAVSNMEMSIIARTDVYRTAISVSTQLKHHLFDTLYHAVALQSPDATFITADAAYYRKAQGLGRILLLKDFTV